jgi:hypothetical protein
MDIFSIRATSTGVLDFKRRYWFFPARAFAASHLSSGLAATPWAIRMPA